MPLMPDTRIAGSALSGGGQSGDGGGFLGTLGSMMKIKEQSLLVQQQQREAEKAKREEEDDLETRAALQRHERPDEAINDLWKAGRSAAAGKLAQSVYTERKVKLDAYDSQIKSQQTAMEQASSILDSITDDKSLTTARPALIALARPSFGDAAEDMIPTVYGDGKRIKELARAGSTHANNLLSQHNDVMELQDAIFKGLKPDANGMWSANGIAAQEAYRNLLVRKLSTAKTKEQWDWYLKTAHENGAPESVMRDVGSWSDSAADRAFQLGLTIPQEATHDVAQQRADDYGESVDQRTGRARGGRTQIQLDALEDRQQDEYAKVDKWWKAAFVEDNRDQSKWDEGTIKDPKTGKMVPSGVKVAPQPRVEGLSKANQDKYVADRLYIENTTRKRRGDRPLEQAAKAAIANQDVAEYNRLAGIYHNITTGLLELRSVVPAPWAPVVQSPGQVDKTKAAADLAAQILAEKDPEKKALLQYKQKQLFGL